MKINKHIIAVIQAYKYAAYRERLRLCSHGKT